MHTESSALHGREDTILSFERAHVLVTFHIHQTYRFIVHGEKCFQILRQIWIDTHQRLKYRYGRR